MTNAVATILVSAFCHCSACCGKADGITASGRHVRANWTVAYNGLPLGTKVNIVGLGVRAVEDRTAKRFSNRIDVYMPSHRAAKRWGVRKMRVEVIR